MSFVFHGLCLVFVILCFGPSWRRHVLSTTVTSPRWRRRKPRHDYVYASAE